MLIIFDLDDTLFPRLPDNYTLEELNKIQPFPGVVDILRDQRFKKILVTKGEEKLQNKKIDNLNIRKYFHQIIVCKSDEKKKTCFKDVAASFPDKEILVIGDRIDSEIRWGNELGFRTIRLKQGKYKDLKPKASEEIPNHEVENFSEIRAVMPLD